MTTTCQSLTPFLFVHYSSLGGFSRPPLFGDCVFHLVFVPLYLIYHLSLVPCLWSRLPTPCFAENSVCPCLSAYLTLNSIHSLFLYSSPMLSQSRISLMVWIRDTCQASSHLFCFLSMNLLPVGPKGLKKTQTRKKCERQSIARFRWYQFYWKRLQISIVDVYDTVWRPVSFCCGYTIYGVSFFISDFWKTQSLFYLWLYRNAVQFCLNKVHTLNMDILTGTHQLCLTLTTATMY